MKKRSVILSILNILAAIAIWIGVIVLTERCNDKTSRISNKKYPDGLSNSRYILIDDSSCVHLQNCPSIKVRYHQGARVRYVDTADVYKETLEWFCPICIKQKEYEHIQHLLYVKNKKSIPGF